MLAITSSRSSSSPGVESNETNVTCFDLISSSSDMLIGEMTKSKRIYQFTNISFERTIYTLAKQPSKCFSGIESIKFRKLIDSWAFTGLGSNVLMNFNEKLFLSDQTLTF